jgi:uncharacterized membrane protein
MGRPLGTATARARLAGRLRVAPGLQALRYDVHVCLDACGRGAEEGAERENAPAMTTGADMRADIAADTGADTGAAVAGRGPRIALIDILKGVAILAMVVYHFAWDLSAFQLVAVDVTNDLAWRVFARGIAATFVFLVGINLVLANRGGLRPKPYVRRLALILGAALLVTVATWYLFGAGGFVFFGILHLIFVASLLAVPFLSAPAWVTLPVAAFFVFGARFLAGPAFDGWPWYWLGLSPNPPASFDFVPVFPWFGVALLGVAAGRLIVASPGLRLWRWQPRGVLWAALAWAGRWSLLIYLLHQVILYPAVSVVAPLVGPSEAALSRQFTAMSEMRCALGGFAAEPCRAFATCLADAFAGDPGFLSDYARGILGSEDAEHLADAEMACQVRFLLPPTDGAI